MTFQNNNKDFVSVDDRCGWANKSRTCRRKHLICSLWEMIKVSSRCQWNSPCFYYTSSALPHSLYIYMFDPLHSQHACIIIWLIYFIISYHFFFLNQLFVIFSIILFIQWISINVFRIHLAYVPFCSISYTNAACGVVSTLFWT